MVFTWLSGKFFAIFNSLLYVFTFRNTINTVREFRNQKLTRFNNGRNLKVLILYTYFFVNFVVIIFILSKMCFCIHTEDQECLESFDYVIKFFLKLISYQKLIILAIIFCCLYCLYGLYFTFWKWIDYFDEDFSCVENILKLSFAIEKAPSMFEFNVVIDPRNLPQINCWMNEREKLSILKTMKVIETFYFLVAIVMFCVVLGIMAFLDLGLYQTDDNFRIYSLPVIYWIYGGGLFTYAGIVMAFLFVIMLKFKLDISSIFINRMSHSLEQTFRRPLSPPRQCINYLLVCQGMFVFVYKRYDHINKYAVKKVLSMSVSLTSVSNLVLMIVMFTADFEVLLKMWFLGILAAQIIGTMFSFGAVIMYTRKLYNFSERLSQYIIFLSNGNRQSLMSRETLCKLNFFIEILHPKRPFHFRFLSLGPIKTKNILFMFPVYSSMIIFIYEIMNKSMTEIEEN